MELPASQGEKAVMMPCQRNEQAANARVPLKLINGTMPAQPRGKDLGVQHVRIFTENGLKLFEFPRTSGQVLPQGSASSREPSLDLRLGNADPGDNVRLTMQPGVPGFCLDFNTQPQQPEVQKRGRRMKRPTVIIRPKLSSSEMQPMKELEPCGVLGELKPGIIGRLRDSRHIHSILGAVVGTTSIKRLRESLPSDPKQEAWKQSKCEDPDSDCLSLEAVFKNQTREHEDTLDSGDAAANASIELSSQTMSDDCQVKQEDDMSIPNHTADPAAQYFELINLDIKGRIAALKRSRRRVRTAIVAKDDTLCMAAENFSAPSNHDDPEKLKRQYELQMDRWKALFVSMDASLGVEAANLENQWRKLQTMQNQFRASGGSMECLCFSP